MERQKSISRPAEAPAFPTHPGSGRSGEVGGSEGRRRPGSGAGFRGHRKECNPLDIGGSAACRRQLSRQCDCLALLRFSVIDLDLEHRETPLQVSGRLHGCLSVLNSLLTRPSTSIAKPLAGRSVPDLNTGVVVPIRCARCWRMGKLRSQGFASERMKPEIVPVRHRWTATGHGTQSHLFGRCIVATYQSSDRICAQRQR